MGVIAYGLLAFSLGVRYLSVVDHRYAVEEPQTVACRCSRDGPSLICLLDNERADPCRSARLLSWSFRNYWGMGLRAISRVRRRRSIAVTKVSSVRRQIREVLRALDLYQQAVGRIAGDDHRPVLAAFHQTGVGRQIHAAGQQRGIVAHAALGS